MSKYYKQLHNILALTASTVTAHYITLGLTYMNNGEAAKAQEARNKIQQTLILIQQ